MSENLGILDNNSLSLIIEATGNTIEIINDNVNLTVELIENEEIQTIEFIGQNSSATIEAINGPQLTVELITSGCGGGEPDEYIKDTYVTGSTIFVKHKDDSVSGYTIDVTIPLHNDLTGLQGGGTDEFYHLSLAQFNNLGKYQRLYDGYTGLTSYTGFAFEGQPTSVSTWTINKIITQLNGDSSKTTFTGATWDNRYSL